MVPIRRSGKGAKGSKGKAKGKGKNGKNGYHKDKGTGKGNEEAYPSLPPNGHRGGRGKGRGDPRSNPTPHTASPPPWGPKHTVVVKPHKGDLSYQWRKAVEVVTRAGGFDSEVGLHLRRALDEQNKAHEETLPISQRIARHEKRLQTATADFNKKVAAHTALEEEINGLTEKLAKAHEAMWESRHRITTLEEELEVLRALDPPPPPPPSAAAATPAATSAGGEPDSIENILYTAMHGITKILPADRLGPFAKAFEAVHEMFTAEAQEAQRAQQDRERAHPPRDGATADDAMETTEDRTDKKPRTAPAAPAAREPDVGPIATQPAQPQVSARDPTRDRSPRRTAQGTPASSGATGSIGGDMHESPDVEERPSGKGKDGKKTGPVVDIKGQPSNARGGASLT